jgi:hypothetical protein
MRFYILLPYYLGWREEVGHFTGPMTLRWWRSRNNIFIQPQTYNNPNWIIK